MLPGVTGVSLTVPAGVENGELLLTGVTALAGAGAPFGAVAVALSGLGGMVSGPSWPQPASAVTPLNSRSVAENRSGNK